MAASRTKRSSDLIQYNGLPQIRPVAMNKDSPPIWSKQYSVATNSSGQHLPGDKILLPQSALEQLLSAYAKVNADETASSRPAYDQYSSTSFSAYKRVEYEYQDRNQQLPQPLTFKLTNPHNSRTVYAGVREFSAEDECVVLSDFLLHALGIERADDVAAATITVHAKQVPKGTFVRLRPLEAGYDPADWKALLEQYMRSNYTTLTNGEVLTLSAGKAANGGQEHFKFLIDGFKPDSDAVCVVDTDLEVDIEALNEEQARETLQKISERLRKTSGSNGTSTVGGALDLFNVQQGQLLPGEYVDYELPAWDRTQPLVFEVDAETAGGRLDLFVSPYWRLQRAKPRLEEHVFADLDGRPSKRIRLDPSNTALEHAEALWVSLLAYDGGKEQSAETDPIEYSIRARHTDSSHRGSSHITAETAASEDDVQCNNCRQWIPRARLVLHENFCLRNNILCPHGCGQVFQRRSPEYEMHWHCQYDDAYGDTPASQSKHNHQLHPKEVLRCKSCSTQETFSSWPALAQHHVTNCPAKLILCRFCHLEVPQEGDPDAPSAEVLLSGMTQHELLDGARTTECHMCSKIVRLRDMDTHLKSHDLDRLSRSAPQPCRNVNCGRTLETASKSGDTRAGTRMGQGPGNDIALCNVCFGPLYNSMHDPENKALRRRIERRYLQQLLTGCGKSWCKNGYCKTARNAAGTATPTSTKDVLPLIKVAVEKSIIPSSGEPLHFCVDESSQRRRVLAELLAAEDGGPAGRGGYSFEWCLGAVEAENGDLDAARQWLKNWAPARNDHRQ